LHVVVSIVTIDACLCEISLNLGLTFQRIGVFAATLDALICRGKVILHKAELGFALIKDVVVSALKYI
jgi:hypothetical protein